MTIVKGKTFCKNCNIEHDVDIDLNDITIEKLKTAKMTDIKVEQIQEQKPTEKPDSKQKPSFKIPSHIPSGSCKNGSCGKNHKNANYQNPPNQKCENCGQFSFNSKECPWCGKSEFEEIEKETLEELEIPLPESHDDHDHNEE